jgi:hypothetical protein
MVLATFLCSACSNIYVADGNVQPNCLGNFPVAGTGYWTGPMGWICGVKLRVIADMELRNQPPRIATTKAALYNDIQ